VACGRIISALPQELYGAGRVAHTAARRQRGGDSLAGPVPGGHAMPTKKKITQQAASSILDDVHQTLAKHGVTQAVQVRLDDAGPCYEYRLVTDDEGNPVYRMVEVPCK
jgi:hypothetical protein